MLVPLHPKVKNNMGVVPVRSGYSSKKYRKQGILLLSMAGHSLHFNVKEAEMPVDYNDGEHPNLMLIGVFITSSA